MIECKICKQKFRVISRTHLLIHKTDIKSYISKFGHEGVGFTVSVSSLSKNDARYINWRKSLKDRDTAWARGLTKENHPSLAKMAETFRQRKIDNFKRWRDEQRRKGLIPFVGNPLKRSPELAFLIGLILGDGNITKFPRTECLRITLASKYPKLVDYSTGIMQKVFNKIPTVKKVKASECFTITIYQNNISERLGVKTGSRSNYNFEVPEWINQNKEFLINFLRGLYEAEGCFCVHRPTSTHKFIFNNRNDFLLQLVYDKMRGFGFKVNRSGYKVQISRIKDVYASMALLRFRQY